MAIIVFYMLKVGFRVKICQEIGSLCVDIDMSQKTYQSIQTITRDIYPMHYR